MTLDESKLCQSDTVEPESDRRRYFRIADQIGLALTPLTAVEAEHLLERLEAPSSRAGLLNDLQAIRERHLPERRALEYKFPTVATYIKVIEHQIDTLAQAVGEVEDFPSVADTPACLSAQGVSVHWPTTFAVDSAVDLRLTLFPDRVLVRSLARVVRCDPLENGYRLALDFAHVREADREAIIRHVYRLQRLQLQAQAEEAFESRFSPLKARNTQKKPSV